jgi:hypothetical protein
MSGTIYLLVEIDNVSRGKYSLDQVGRWGGDNPSWNAQEFVRTLRKLADEMEATMIRVDGDVRAASKAG